RPRIGSWRGVGMPGFEEFFRKVRGGASSAEESRAEKSETLLKRSGPVMNDSGDVVVDMQVVDAGSVEARVRRHRSAEVEVALAEMKRPAGPFGPDDRVDDERQREGDYAVYLAYRGGPRIPYGQRKANAYLAALANRRVPAPAPPVVRSHVREMIE